MSVKTKKRKGEKERETRLSAGNRKDDCRSANWSIYHLELKVLKSLAEVHNILADVSHFSTYRCRPDK